MSEDKLDLILSSLSEVKRNQDTLMEDVVEIKERLGLVEEKVDSLETRIDSLESRFDTLETKFDHLESRFDTLEAKVDAMHEQVALNAENIEYIKNKQHIQDNTITLLARRSLDQEAALSQTV